MYSREYAAFHEAGHAVMALLLGRDVAYVSIIEDIDGRIFGVPHSHGRTHSDSVLKEWITFLKWITSFLKEFPRSEQECQELHDKLVRLVREEVMIKVAGAVAIYNCPKNLGHHPMDGADGDFLYAYHLIEHICESETSIDEFITTVVKEAIDLLYENRKAVETIADALMEQETLFGHQVKQLFLAATSPDEIP